MPSPQQLPQMTAVPVDTLTYCHLALVPLQAEQQLNILSELFSMYLRENSDIRLVPSDFLELVVRGMRHLQEAGQTNIIYSLAKAVGMMRPDGSDSLLAMKNMPMVLIEYAINLFTASSIQKASIACTGCNVLTYYYHHPLVLQMSCPPDYRCWLQTMYVLFGTKWAKIFAGPMWSYVPIMQASERNLAVGMMNPVNVSDLTTTDLLIYHSFYVLPPLQALVNVPALSERTLRRDIEASGFTTGPEIQV